MGDVADMMLDGTLCEGCGVYLEGESYGVPRYCASCHEDRREFLTMPDYVRPSQTKVSCPKCQRRVKETGLADHLRDKHGIKS